MRGAATILGITTFACASGSGRGDDTLGALSGAPAIFGDTTGDDTSSESGSSTFAPPATSSDEASDDGSDTGSDATDGSDTSTGEPPIGMCAPAPADSPCTACSKQSCCAQLEACSTDVGCSCFMTCVYQSGDVLGCGVSCGVDLFAPGPAGDLVSCSAGPCASACA